MLLTLPPLSLAGSFDLHVLGTPPAFILSQDQTLRKVFYQPDRSSQFRSSLTDMNPNSYILESLYHSLVVKVLLLRARDYHHGISLCQPIQATFSKTRWRLRFRTIKNPASMFPSLPEPCAQAVYVVQQPVLPS